MKKSAYIEIAVILFVLLVGGGIIGSVLIKQKIEMEEKEVVEVVEEVNSAPSFSNIAPNSVKVGEEYIYSVKVLDSDNSLEELSIKLVSPYPNWLSIEGFSISGTPTESDLGTQEVTIELTDGDNIVNDTFYILIEE